MMRAPGGQVRKLALLGALLTAGPAHAAAPFTFRPPEGWTDLLLADAAAPPDGVPAGALARARSGAYAVVALDLSRAAGRFPSSMHAVVHDGSVPITPTLLDQAAARMRQELRREAPTATVEVLRRELVRVAGVSCGRLLMEIAAGEQRYRQLSYFVPSESHHAVITYSASLELFDRYQSAFDASAAATTGIATPPLFWQRLLSSERNATLPRGTLVAALTIVAIALLLKLRDGPA